MTLLSLNLSGHLSAFVPSDGATRCVCCVAFVSYTPTSNRLLEDERRLAGAFDARQELREQVAQVREKNGALKTEYDAMLEQQRGAESRLREEKVRGGRLLDDMINKKQQAAARMNSRNERKSRYLHSCPLRHLSAPYTPVHSGTHLDHACFLRAREVNLQKELQSAVRSKVSMVR